MKESDRPVSSLGKGKSMGKPSVFIPMHVFVSPFVWERFILYVLASGQVAHVCVCVCVCVKYGGFIFSS